MGPLWQLCSDTAHLNDFARSSSGAFGLSYRQAQSDDGNEAKYGGGESKVCQRSKYASKDKRSSERPEVTLRFRGDKNTKTHEQQFSNEMPESLSVPRKSAVKNVNNSRSVKPRNTACVSDQQNGNDDRVLCSSIWMENAREQVSGHRNSDALGRDGNLASRKRQKEGRNLNTSRAARKQADHYDHYTHYVARKGAHSGHNRDKNGSIVWYNRRGSGSTSLGDKLIATSVGGEGDVETCLRRRTRTRQGRQEPEQTRKMKSEHEKGRSLSVDQHSRSSLSRTRDASGNRAGDQRGQPSDVSNNKLFACISGEEDPRMTEERFYGGLESRRLAANDERRRWDRRVFTSPSNTTTFPQAPPIAPPRPHRRRGTMDESTNTPFDEKGYDGKPRHVTDDSDIVGVSTNDAVTGRRLLAHRPLPYGTFKTVSVLLESPRSQAPESKDVAVYVTPHDVPPLATRLQPFVPYDTSATASQEPVASASSQGAAKEKGKAKEEAEEVEAVRLPPVQFKPNPEKDVKGPLAEPFIHPGVAWPLAFASQPPYTSPGHEAAGVKQPVGVLQTGLVPSRPLKARLWDLDTEIPAWVSPLYKTYGVGGPYGRHGPFHEPCILAQDGRWETLVRQAEALGALAVPGVVTDSGGLDLSGMCGDYMLLRKEEEARARAAAKWSCRPCVAVKNFFKKVKVKLGLGTTTKVAEGGEEKKEGGEEEKKSVEAPSGDVGGGRGSQTSGVGDVVGQAEGTEEE